MSELLISLKARRDTCRGYELNNNLQIEACILDKQIAAVEQHSVEQQDKQLALDKFEAAVAEMAWKGSKRPEDWPEIEADYAEAKAKIKSILEID